MTLTETSRTDKVRAALNNSGQWLKVRDQNGRALAYGVPSATTPLLYHFANSTQCTCPAGQHGQRCWHTTAVGLHVAAVRTQRARCYDEIYGKDN
jgi:hypothetical protein